MPARLTEQVIASARQQPAAHAAPKHASHPVLRAALCAAIALALIVGVIPFRFAGSTQQKTSMIDPDPTVPVSAPVFSFGLTAYAADLGEQYPASADGSLAMGSGSGMYWAEQNGFFTGSLLQITGADIQTVSMSLDKGSFYSCRILKDLTPEQMQEIRQAQERGEMAPTSIDQDFDGSWSCQEIIPLDSNITVDYDTDIWYGFWISGGETGGDLRTDYESSVDALDGAALAVMVTFSDGTEQTNRYRLHTGKLRTTAGNNGIALPLPEPAGEDDPYIYGIYAVLEQ